LARALDTLGASGRIGLDESGVAPPLWDALVARAGHGRVVPGADLFGTARRVKAPYEIECLERALHIAEEALNAVIQMLKPGVTEREAVTVLEAEILKREATTYPLTIAFGDLSAVPAPWATDRALRPGELVRFDVGAVYKGYCSNVGRMAVMGEPNARQQQVYEAVQAGLEAAINLVAPGVTAGRGFGAPVTGARARGAPQLQRPHARHRLRPRPPA